MKIDQAIEILENHLYSGKMPSKAHFEALAVAVEALKRRRWIPCSERLPEAGADVLAYSRYKGVVVDYYDGVLWGYDDVTHWMPLPEPPEKGGGPDEP